MALFEGDVKRLKDEGSFKKKFLTFADKTRIHGLLLSEKFRDYREKTAFASWLAVRRILDSLKQSKIET